MRLLKELYRPDKLRDDRIAPGLDLVSPDASEARRAADLDERLTIARLTPPPE